MRLCFGQPCSPCESGRFRRPSPHSAYTYTASGSSPVQSASPKRVPPRSALRNYGFVPKPCFCGLSARPSASPLKTLCVFRRLTGPDRDRAGHPRELGKQRMRSSLAGPCGPFGVRASRSANPTPSARAHLRGKARLLPRAASIVRSAILRRRNTASSSRARPLAHHANCRRAVPLRTPLATASRLTSFGGYRSSHMRR